MSLYSNRLILLEFTSRDEHPTPGSNDNAMSIIMMRGIGDMALNKGCVHANTKGHARDRGIVGHMWYRWEGKGFLLTYPPLGYLANGSVSMVLCKMGLHNSSFEVCITMITVWYRGKPFKMCNFMFCT